MGGRRRILRGIGFYLFCGGLLCTALCSCSLFQAHNEIPQPVTKIQPPPPPPPKTRRPYYSVDLNFPLSLITKPKIYIMKGQRRLLLVQGKTLVREFPVALGPNPKGDKYFEGDGRTPEGKFFVCRKNPDSHYYKSLGINYPTVRDAKIALASGMISYNQFRSIKQANDSMKLPPSNTVLGGQVFIHGGGCYPDWTLGCIAVNNRAMDELFSVVQIGTPVFIKP